MPAPSEPTTDYTEANGLIHKILKRMEFDSQRFESDSFKPSYAYKNSALKDNYSALTETLNANPSIPANIKDQVQQLDVVFKDTVNGMLKKEFDPKTWEANFKGIEDQIATAKTSGQDATALDQLNAKLQEVKEQGLKQEFQKMHENLQRQNAMNFENAVTLRAMEQAQMEQSAFLAKDWRNLTEDDLRQREEMAGVAGLQTGLPLHTGADGVYSKEDSYYTVTKRTDNDGNPSYEATFTRAPKMDSRVAAEAYLELAMFGLSVTGVTLAFEIASSGLALLGWALTGGKITPPHSLPFTDLHRIFVENRRFFDQREGNAHDKAKAEIDVAWRRCGEHNLVIDSGSKNKSIGLGELEQILAKIQVLEQKAGYKPGIGITKPQDAMGLMTTTNFEDKIGAIPAKTQFNYETRKLIQQFYKNQNNGSLSGYDENKFKDYIFNEIRSYKEAMARMEHEFGKDQKATNASTITPKGDDFTSTISESGKEPAPMPTSSTIMPSPSAPPAPEEKTIDLEARGLDEVVKESRIRTGVEHVPEATLGAKKASSSASSLKPISLDEIELTTPEEKTEEKKSSIRPSK